jgi:aspartate/methionine/tyrosine aminotransferase
VDILILVDPANPLIFRLSKDATKEVDRIALKEGIEIIVDDVLRGTLPIGERESAARLLSRPYVVEGFSKRFGEYPFGTISYVLVPEDDKIVRRIAGIYFPCLCGEYLQAAFKQEGKAMMELRRRNEALDKGLKETFPEIRPQRPGDAYLLALLHIPNDKGGCGCSRGISKHIEARYDGAFFPYYRKRWERGIIRVMVGMMGESKVYRGARVLGRLLREG